MVTRRDRGAGGSRGRRERPVVARAANALREPEAEGEGVRPRLRLHRIAYLESMHRDHSSREVGIQCQPCDNRGMRRIASLIPFVVLMGCSIEPAETTQSEAWMVVPLRFEAAASSQTWEGTVPVEIGGSAASITLPDDNGELIEISIRARGDDDGFRLEAAYRGTVASAGELGDAFRPLEPAVSAGALGMLEHPGLVIEFFTASESSEGMSGSEAVGEGFYCSCGGGCPCCVRSGLCSACCGSLCGGCAEP